MLPRTELKDADIHVLFISKLQAAGGHARYTCTCKYIVHYVSSSIRISVGHDIVFWFNF